MTAAVLGLLLATDVVQLLDDAAWYVERVREEFRQYVAEERETQKFYDRSSKLRQTRDLVADYYFVSFPSRSEQTYEFRDVISVDGRSRRRTSEDRLKLLTKPGRSFEEEYYRLKHESNRYNLFSGRGFLSNVALGLLGYFSHPVQRQASYGLVEESGGDAVFEFIERGPRTLLREGEGSDLKPLPAAGRARVSAKGAIREIEATVTLDRRDHRVTVRYAVEYGAGPGRILIPRQRSITVRRAGWGNGVVAESLATYSNLRRFGADSVITVEP